MTEPLTVAADPAPPAPTRPTSTASADARMSAVTGLLFAGLLVAALVFVDSSPHLSASDSDFTAFYSGGGTALVTAGLYLVPFAGIAFLYSMTSLRRLLAARMDTAGSMPFGLQLLGGILFVAMVFAGMAAAGGSALLHELGVTGQPSSDIARSFLAVGYGLVFVYAVRGAGMYVISSTTLLLRAGLLPRWVALVSYLAAAFMLISTTLNPIGILLLPAWALLSGAFVFQRRRHPFPTNSEEK